MRFLAGVTSQQILVPPCRKRPRGQHHRDRRHRTDPELVLWAASTTSSNSRPPTARRCSTRRSRSSSVPWPPSRRQQSAKSPCRPRISPPIAGHRGRLGHLTSHCCPSCLPYGHLIRSSIPGGSMKALLIDDHPLILSGSRSSSRIRRRRQRRLRRRPRGRPRAPGRGRQSRHRAARPPAWRLQRLRLLEELRAAYPSLSVVVVSSSDSNDDVSRAIYLGAMGFIPKRASNEVLFEALTW